MRRGSSALAALLVTFSPMIAPARAQKAAGDDEKNVWFRAAHPNRVHYREVMAEASESLLHESWPSASERLREAARLEPDLPEVHLLLAYSASRGQKWSECASEFQRASALDPDFASGTPWLDSRELDRFVALGAGMCLAFAGFVDESVVNYRRQLARRVLPAEDQVDLHWFLGDSLHALGRLDEAIREYQRGLERQPTRIMLHFALAVALDRDGQTAKAWDTMERAVKLDSSEGLLSSVFATTVLFLPAYDVDYYAGFAYQVKGRRQLAIAHFRRYVARVALKTRHPETHQGGGWQGRVAEHLADLGPPGLSAADLATYVNDRPVEKPAAKRAVLAHAAAWSKCLVAHPEAWLGVTITWAPTGRPAIPPAVTVGPGVAVPAEVAACVRALAQDVLPAVGRTDKTQVVRFGVVAE